MNGKKKMINHESTIHNIPMNTYFWSTVVNNF